MMLARGMGVLRPCTMSTTPVGLNPAVRVWMARYVESHMRRALAPLLFDDHARAAAEQQRRSAVAPARRSKAALAKGRPRAN